MNTKNLLEECALIIFTLCLCVFVYYGFITNMSTDMFTLEEFTEKYSQGIFRYRVLGRELTELIYYNINTIPFFLRTDRMMEYLNIKTMPFYHSLFIVNTASTIFCTFFLSRLSRLPFLNLQDFGRILFVIFCSSLICLTQYTVTPYDCLSYMFLLSSTYFFFRYHSNKKVTIVLLMVCSVAGILTRETHFMFSSLLIALYIIYYREKEWTVPLTIPLFVVLISLCTYIGLRIYYGFEEAIYYAGPLPSFRTIKYASILFFLSITTLLYVNTTHENKRIMRVFFLCSVPYFIVILRGGILAEARLWIPHILIATIIANLQIPKRNVLS